ncbi:SUN domain-containing protein 5 [Choanephora cucurbitarum]|uniref:SUN domain-containing protein 5 n=1 Tax=Choanephora cucurbitarum TaxID=101091 RepID=A0A1C7NR35_9FUNG|nr:SUN domain-containing protein 5 [Choanephora cucurbitarum]
MSAFVRPPISEARLDTAEDYFERLEQPDSDDYIESDENEDNYESEQDDNTNVPQQDNNTSVSEQITISTGTQQYTYESIKQLFDHIPLFCWLFFAVFPLLVLLLSWLISSKEKPQVIPDNQVSQLRDKMSQLQEFFKSDMMNFEQENTQLASLLDEQKNTIQTLYKLLEQRVLDDVDTWLGVVLENQKQNLFQEDAAESSPSDQGDLPRESTFQPSQSDRLERIERIVASLPLLKQQEALQKPNFASFEHGARIFHAYTTSTYSPYGVLFEFLSDLLLAQKPEVVLLSDGREHSPWSMKGDKGALTIVLTESIEIQEVVLAHPHATLTTNEIQHAPKDIEILGIDYEEKMAYSLGNFTYHTEDTRGFLIDHKLLQNKLFNIVMIKIHSNWGNSFKTDIYRVRVHGNTRQA